LGNLRKNAFILNNIAKTNKYQGKYSEALENSEEALEIAEKIGDVNLKNDTLGLIKSLKERTFESYERSFETESSQQIRKIKQEIICNPKWNAIDIKNFLKGFFDGFFNSIRDSSNWQRVKTVLNESKPNIFEISSGDNFKAYFQIIEESKKRRTLQIEWEARSLISRQIWENIVKNLIDIFKKPGIKSLKKR
ncbi:MAG: tetratricopeptide repeat protein, partial [Promethearchaeota archaeon]